MRRILMLILLLLILAVPARAAKFTAPDAPASVERYLPDETQNFGEGLWFVISSAMEVIQPSLVEAVKICVSLIVLALILGLLPESSSSTGRIIAMVGTAAAGVILFQPVDTLIRLGTQTVTQISHYGKLLLPVMAGALAAQGAVTKSSALYMATAVFDSILTSAISELLIPMVYIFLCVTVSNHLFHQPLLQQIGNFIKWIMTWGLKVVLYVFTGYISITGVVGGSTDAAMLKATKLTISGAVPVVGSILSDASEAVLVSVGVVKNSVGIYGLLVIIALWIGPFLQIGVQYLLLKITSGITEMFGLKQVANLIKDFSGAMGLVLAMTGTVCMIFLISTICFLKGAA